MTHLVLYDGVCGLCDRFVHFLLKADRHDRLRFAALQGPLAAEILAAHGRRQNSLSTVIVIADHGESPARLLDRSDAALFALESMGGIYRLTALFRIVPRPIRDAIYAFIAKRRYRVFGRFDACPVPPPGSRAKFLDVNPRPSPS